MLAVLCRQAAAKADFLRVPLFLLKSTPASQPSFNPSPSISHLPPPKQFDYIIGMDDANLAAIRRAAEHWRGKDGSGDTQVPADYAAAAAAGPTHSLVPSFSPCPCPPPAGAG